MVPFFLTDRSILSVAAFLRALAVGMGGVLLGLSLAARGFAPAEIGVVVSAGLAGAALASLGVTLAAGRFAVRAMLIGLAVLGALGAVAVAYSPSTLLAALAALLGMVNGMGRDRSAAAVIEQAALPATVSDAERTGAFAWYTVAQDVGHALGALLAALPSWLSHAGISDAAALRLGLASSAVPLALCAPLYARLAPALDRLPTAAHAAVSPEGRRTVRAIAALFLLDAIGGGFLTSALLAYFFAARFAAGSAAIAALFFVARIANAGSHLAAAWLARRIGLLNTIVLTHLPSSLLLLTVPFAPSFPIAALLFLVRESLVEMDVPTRQSFVMAVIRPEERLWAAGITSLVRLGGWAVAPLLAGALMQEGALAAPLVAAAAIKIAYDVLLYLGFRRVRPPEERGTAQ
ncbi:MAG: MFS transporter [Deltaproteobacteria bacterium]|nr:MFS transporter [Deltaproteobacteria bacterium]